jgi:hypothetical protein
MSLTLLPEIVVQTFPFWINHVDLKTAVMMSILCLIFSKVHMQYPVSRVDLANT